MLKKYKNAKYNKETQEIQANLIETKQALEQLEDGRKSYEKTEQILKKVVDKQQKIIMDLCIKNK